MPRLFDNKYRIKSSRLSQWDYGSPGLYFVTICTKGRIKWFGETGKNHMKLSVSGSIVKKGWHALSAHYSGFVLDEFVVMPNHIHGIIQITDHLSVNHVETGHAPPLHRNNNLALGNMIGSFISAASKHIHKLNSLFSWQPRFYDHIIRNEASFMLIRNYIKYNASNW